MRSVHVPVSTSFDIQSKHTRETFFGAAVVVDLRGTYRTYGVGGGTCAGTYDSLLFFFIFCVVWVLL